MSKANDSTIVAEASDAILTLPNVITFFRLCMVPAFFVAVLKHQDIVAAVLFAVAACTDFVDGQIARRTNCVSKLGQLLDPAVDRCLMIFGVIGLLIVGRLPLWIVVVVVIRDLYLLIGGTFLLQKYRRRVPVIFLGKLATTLLFVGFAGLTLNMPLVDGLGWVNASWLPGFNSNACSWSIWFVYAGLILTVFTTTHYTIHAWATFCEAREQEAAARRIVK